MLRKSGKQNKGIITYIISTVNVDLIRQNFLDGVNIIFSTGVMQGDFSPQHWKSKEQWGIFHSGIKSVCTDFEKWYWWINRSFGKSWIVFHVHAGIIITSWSVCLVLMIQPHAWDRKFWHYVWHLYRYVTCCIFEYLKKPGPDLQWFIKLISVYDKHKVKGHYVLRNSQT